jgi:hypothetical protein
VRIEPDALEGWCRGESRLRSTEEGSLERFHGVQHMTEQVFGPTAGGGGAGRCGPGARAAAWHRGAP